MIMNCADKYHELLLYLEQAQGDLNEVFEKTTSSSTTPAASPTGLKQPLPKIDEEIYNASINNNNNNKNDSDPEDIEVNLQILIKLDEAIRADLNDLLANHNNNLTNYQQFCKDNNNDLNRTTITSAPYHNNQLLLLDQEDEKNYLEIDALSDIGGSLSPSLSTTTTNNVATQTSRSPSASSTNLTWASSSPGSDTESSSESSSINNDPSLSSWSIINTKRNLNSGKSNSAPILEKISPYLKVSRQSRSQSDRHLAEIEAAEACKWLRAAGFPQYAQMYEDMQFPIDIAQASQDHPLLGNDILHSLFRRLKILNSCAHIHHHHHHHQQQRVSSASQHSDDESDDEYCALSENWTYQKDVRRWSRNCTNIPNIEDQNVEVFEKNASYQTSCCSSSSSREKLKRTGSSKFRRRREGVCFSEQDYSLDTISTIGSLKALELNHVSDSEITPKHHHSSNNTRKVRTKSCDKTECWTSRVLTPEKSIWKKLDSTAESSRIPEPDAQHQENNFENCVNLHSLSATQFQVLRKLALLKLTAHMEKYCPSHRTGWNWDLPKFIRKMKSPVYKDKNVFGVPLTITLQRTGQVLPRNIEEALRWLQLNAADQIGIFRKPGVKSRIQSLRNMVESNFGSIDYSEQQSYDVADMVKQYFRDLPETLLTNKLSETFILIFQHIPVSLRKETVLCALLLMPDEHLEVLQALLYFLLTVSKHSDLNQMNESNLAMCFAPSLFQYSQAYLNKHNNLAGTPHPKELAENKAGYDCLYYLLRNFNNIFQIPKDFLLQSGDIKETKAKLLKNWDKDWEAYLDHCQVNLLKEAKEKHRGGGWISIINNYSRVEIAYKKVADEFPLKLWKVSVEIEAPPFEVLHRILRERHIWDPDLHSARIVAQLEQNVEIYQFVRSSIPPRPAEEFCVIRTWKKNLPKDACLLVETSVEHHEAINNNISNSIRGLVLASRYLIEPCGSGKSKILHLSRIDTMGRAPEWYQKHFGHIQAIFLANIQRSFAKHQNSLGPESKG